MLKILTLFNIKVKKILLVVHCNRVYDKSALCLKLFISCPYNFSTDWLMSGVGDST